MDKLMICRELLRDFVLAEGAEVASGAWDDSRAMALAQAAFDAGAEAGYDDGFCGAVENYQRGRIDGYRECLDDYEITTENEIVEKEYIYLDEDTPLWAMKGYPTQEDAHYWGGQ